ncbi:MAG: hypothetical protein BWY61_01859 [Firmicutes bacterium ADurb.Bin354]|nr:MAG: hypothetical protein BWY61_01859 [Firmicutes bacterium ADurb.Bin354]
MEMGDITNLMDYTSSLASASNVDKTAKASSSAKTDEEMLDACKEFESYLWEQVLKSMKSASEVFNTKEDDKTVSYFKDTAMTEVAKQITEQNLGGNSLAMQMYEQMQRNQGISGDEIRARMAAAAGSSNNSLNGSDGSDDSES